MGMVGMLTRRCFLGTLAALAASRVAPVPVAAAPKLRINPAVLPLIAELRRMKLEINDAMYGDGPDRFRRRDDGDTLLELR
jgi:hypothetical protein